MERTFAEDMLARARSSYSVTFAPTMTTARTRRVVQAILVRACPCEDDLADVISALGRALYPHLAVRRVLGEIQRLQPPQVVDRAGFGVARLMAQAHQAGDYGPLAELLLVALEEPRWLPRIRDEWGKAATAWAVNGLPAKKYPLALLISGWLQVFGRVPSWMCELADAHPDLVTSNVIPLATRWQLHTAAPTAASWHHLAGARGMPKAIEPALLGDKADVAMQTLQQAIGETTDEGVRLRLQTWFRELTSEVP